ncbi:unnamed protein product [Trifolium pratense]|uniref:Uncharacterized protein n=1 Tax=Trifolium pratense TaxID=57577 RepID=A0ACB0LCG7_TRIPR|nr:unnamed protein product [Trifolium pratense]
MDHLRNFVFSNIWKSDALSKVVAFAWQLMLNRIPTKVNLTLRGIGNDMVCSFYNVTAENTLHMFLHCGTSAKIWYELVQWIGQELLLPPSFSLSFSMMVGCGIGKKGKKGLMLIWHAYIWRCSFFIFIYY